jgi:arginyl-tRNA--protein-N-Asp/Glu arginylyltransferase
VKLLFSEHRADYANYIFPYAIWGFPEAGETPADLFDNGFLPSSRNLDRFYLCRQIRIDLPGFRLSSENRRILRKGAGISSRLVPRSEFDYTPARRSFYKAYADAKFGRDVMSFERLDALFASPIVSHLLVFRDDEAGGKEVGAVTLYCESRRLAYYYYAFYDLDYFKRNLGLYMMTTAVELFAEQGCKQLHLGSCYSENALYKTQFKGAVFFNGFQWSGNLKELKYMLEREQHPARQHLLETEEFRCLFYHDDIPEMIEASAFRVNLK